MVFNKERQLEFLDGGIKQLEMMIDSCNPFVLIQKDIIDGIAEETIKAGYISHEEFDEKFFNRIHNASHRFHDRCKCGVIKK